MKRRWRLLICLALLLLVLGSLLHPAVHWRVIGWWRGEAFYQGRPTSWWSTELQRWGPAYYIGLDGGLAYSSEPYWCRRSSWWEDALRTNVGVASSSQPPLVQAGDRAAIPLLVELLAHEDVDVRHIAVYGLGRLGKEAQMAVPTLMQFVEEAEKRKLAGGDGIRWWLDHGAFVNQVKHALKRIDPEAAAKAWAE